MEPRWLDDREQRAWRAFLDLRRVLRIGIERQLAEGGLSSADYELLVPLSEAPGRRMRPRDLGAQVGWDRSRLAHHLRRMEDRGLVAREECSTDARGILIRLTERGLKTMEAAAPGHVEWVRTNFIDKLTRAELDALTRLSQRVVSEIEGG
jgi:DNA-binding MarR family transcriptional regulator